MDVILVMTRGDGSYRTFPLTKNRIVIGRINSCDLRVPLNSISRQHCEITLSEGQVQLRDMDSSNGTYHNGRRIQNAVLGPGDRISIGPVVFRILIEGKPADLLESLSSPPKAVAGANARLATPKPRPVSSSQSKPAGGASKSSPTPASVSDSAIFEVLMDDSTHGQTSSSTSTGIPLADESDDSTAPPTR